MQFNEQYLLEEFFKAKKSGDLFRAYQIAFLSNNESLKAKALEFACGAPHYMIPMPPAQVIPFQKR